MKASRITPTGSGTLTVRDNSANKLIEFANNAQQMGFFGAAVTAQPAHIADPAGAATDQDDEARAAIVAIIDALKALGLLAADP